MARTLHLSMFVAAATAALATNKPRQAIIIVNGDAFRLSEDIRLPINQVITDFCYNHSLDVVQCHSTLGAVFQPNIADDEAPQQITLDDESDNHEIAGTAASAFSHETLAFSEEGRKMLADYDDVKATNEYGAASNEYHGHGTHANKWTDEEIMRAPTTQRCPKIPQYQNHLPLAVRQSRLGTTIYWVLLCVLAFCTLCPLWIYLRRVTTANTLPQKTPLESTQSQKEVQQARNKVALLQARTRALKEELQEAQRKAKQQRERMAELQQQLTAYKLKHKEAKAAYQQRHQSLKRLHEADLLAARTKAESSNTQLFLERQRIQMLEQRASDTAQAHEAEVSKLRDEVQKALKTSWRITDRLQRAEEDVGRQKERLRQLQQQKQEMELSKTALITTTESAHTPTPLPAAPDPSRANGWDEEVHEGWAEAEADADGTKNMTPPPGFSPPRSKKVDTPELESTESDSKAPSQQQKKKKKRRRHRKKRKQQQKADAPLDDEDLHANADTSDPSLRANLDSKMDNEANAAHTTPPHSHSHTHSSTRASGSSVMQLSPVGDGEDDQKVLRWEMFQELLTRSCGPEATARLDHQLDDEVILYMVQLACQHKECPGPGSTTVTVQLRECLPELADPTVLSDHNLMRFLYGLASAHDFFNQTFTNPDDNALTDMDASLALHSGVDAGVEIGSDIGANDGDITGGDVGGDADGKDKRSRGVSGGIHKGRVSTGVLENRVPILPDHASSEAATELSPFAKQKTSGREFDTRSSKHQSKIAAEITPLVNPAGVEMVRSPARNRHFEFTSNDLPATVTSYQTTCLSTTSLPASSSEITPKSKASSGSKYHQQSMTDYYDDSTPWVRVPPEEEDEDEVQPVTSLFEKRFRESQEPSDDDIRKNVLNRYWLEEDDKDSFTVPKPLPTERHRDDVFYYNSVKVGRKKLTKKQKKQLGMI